MDEYSTHSLNELLEEITRWPVGMPVRAMERVLAMGEGVVPSLTAALQQWRGDDDRDLLWLVVLLGEIGSANGVQSLVDQLQRTDEDELAEAAAEALAKIGVPSLEVLSQLSTASNPLVRIYAYAALGGIRDERAFAILTDALGRDRESGGAIGQALYEQGRKEAVPILYSAYRNCEPWQRVDFEEAIRDLHFGRTVTPLWRSDWRVRYRRNPELGGYDVGWLAISILLRKHGDVSQRTVPPLRSLEEITSLGADPEPAETCEQCGAPIEYSTGLPVCPETAVDVTLAQVRFLGAARDSGLTDIFELYDLIDYSLWEHHETESPAKARKRKRWQETREDLAIRGRTCRWLIEQRLEDVGAGRAFLLAKAAELASRFGDPEGLLLPAETLQPRARKVGRNEPCPCGSGQKFKRCCLGKG
ncbi:MAG TPA: HEAT repeat domain-containing protein [Candidatus Binatia bacterium]|nr:HEAT repeat domain-containing protein [Candidatus Binatia bacterium]